MFSRAVIPHWRLAGDIRALATTCVDGLSEHTVVLFLQRRPIQSEQRAEETESRLFLSRLVRARSVESGDECLVSALLSRVAVPTVAALLTAAGRYAR